MSNILGTIWNEIEHILGIAEAVAPIVAVNDPGAASNIAKAEAAVNAVTPVVNAVASASATALTDEMKVQLTTQAITAGANIAVATGKVSTETGQLLDALAPAIAGAVAAHKDVTAPIGAVRG